MSVSITPDGENQFLVKFTGVYLSYPHLFEPFNPKTPQLGSDGKPKPGKYGAKFCFDRNDPQSKADAVAIYKKCVELAKTALKQTLPSDRYCMRDGKHLTEDMHGFFVLSASEDTPPLVVDRRKNKVTAEDDLFYPGCKVNATVRLWVQNSNEWGKRINANFIGCQFAEHAERWGGRAKPKVDDVFDDVSGEYADDEYAGEPTGESNIGQDGDGFGDGL